MRVLGCFLVLVAACRPPGYGEEGDPIDAGVDAADVTVDAGDPPIDGAQVTCEGAFRLEGHGSATSVWLTGDFTGWAGTVEAGAVALALGGDSVWTGTRTFDAGTYQYKFIVDGTSWIADPGNPDTVDDGFGGVNSLYVCE